MVIGKSSIGNIYNIMGKTRKLLKDSSAQGNLLIMSFIDVVDLYEHAMESHQNYEVLQDYKFGLKYINVTCDLSANLYLR
jgi:hypothetical protein